MSIPSTSVIDFHTHAFPDALAPRAIAQLAANAAASGYVPHTDGTLSGLLASMDAAGISRSVVCNIATNPRQMTKVNDFALATAQKEPRLIPLGSLHPGAPVTDLEAEASRISLGGLPGIKIHPDYVGVELDDPAFDPIFALCEEHDLFVITHAGFDPVSPNHVYCTPDMILHVLDRHPRLTLIAAHTGGFDREVEVLAKLCGTSVYLDTSLSAIRASRDPAWGEKCAAILRAHDPNRLLFGSDSPWSYPAEELAFLRSVGLSEEILEKILHRNAENLIYKTASNPVMHL